jgi:hypothetical protein
MAATQFAVVYGTVSKVIRRFVEPGSENTDDSHIALAQQHLAPGESLMAFNLSDFPTSRTRADVQPQIGAPAHSGRCAVVAAGVATATPVVNVIQADPLIDSVPGHTLVQHDTAGIGWTYLSGVFTAPVVTTVAPTSGSIIP